jgi:hypothetical protein
MGPLKDSELKWTFGRITLTPKSLDIAVEKSAIRLLPGKSVYFASSPYLRAV